jgi:hypothetical protein
MAGAIWGTQALTASERARSTGAGRSAGTSAEAESTRLRVFCASMANVFDNKVPTLWRVDLQSLIRSTLPLDWLLPAKRTQNIRDMLPTDWGEGWPHACLGTTTENQEEANRHIPHLVASRLRSDSSASSLY